MALNPLDDLIVRPVPASPRPHSSGRRELRLERAQAGVTMYHRARTMEEAVAAQVSGRAVATTLPIKRKGERRPEGMSARQWRKQRRKERNAETAARETAAATYK